VCLGGNTRRMKNLRRVKGKRSGGEGPPSCSTIPADQNSFKDALKNHKGRELRSHASAWKREPKSLVAKRGDRERRHPHRRPNGKTEGTKGLCLDACREEGGGGKKKIDRLAGWGEIVGGFGEEEKSCEDTVRQKNLQLERQPARGGRNLTGKGSSRKPSRRKLGRRGRPRRNDYRKTTCPN